MVEVGEENKSPWTAVHGSLVLHDERQTRQTHPAQWVGLKELIRGLGVGGRKREMVGITVRGKRVGSWGKKKKEKESKRKSNK